MILKNSSFFILHFSFFIQLSHLDCILILKYLARIHPHGFFREAVFPCPFMDCFFFFLKATHVIFLSFVSVTFCKSQPHKRFTIKKKFFLIFHIRNLKFFIFLSLLPTNQNLSIIQSFRLESPIGSI